MSVGCIFVLSVQYFGNTLRYFFGVASEMIEVSHVMTRFVTVHILSYHTSTENRQLFIGGNCQSEHRVEFLFKSLNASHCIAQSFDILWHKPTIMPSVAFAEVFTIIFGVKRVDELPFAILRTEESSFFVEEITPVFSAFGKVSLIFFFIQSFGKLCNTPIVVSVL